MVAGFQHPLAERHDILTQQRLKLIAGGHAVKFELRILGANVDRDNNLVVRIRHLGVRIFEGLRKGSLRAETLDGKLFRSCANRVLDEIRMSFLNGKFGEVNLGGRVFLVLGDSRHLGNWLAVV